MLCAILFKRARLTTNINFKNQDFEIDFVSNKGIYDGLTSDTDSFKQDKIIDYYLLNRDKLFSDELIEFLKSTGIDPKKENEIHHYKLDDKFVIEGWYDIIGRVLTDDEVTSFNWDIDACSINVHFGSDSRDGIHSELKNFATFRFDFAIVIPKEKLKG